MRGLLLAREGCPFSYPSLPGQLLGVEGSTLREALTHRKIIAKGEEVGVGWQVQGSPYCQRFPSLGLPMLERRL